MPTLLSASLDNLLSPMILFFALGMAAAWAKSDLELPEGLGKGLSIYLMLAIGFKGGAELGGHGWSGQLALSLLAAISLSFIVPILAYTLLRKFTRLPIPDAAAVAAHYGSISIVTFVTAVGFLNDQGVPYEGYLVAMLALMETPAIISGLLLARRDPAVANRHGRQVLPKDILHEVLLSGSIVLLIGSFLIGWVSGSKGLETLAPFIVDPFKGILCLFLLDMGLLAGRRLKDFRAIGPGLLAFGLYMPILGGLLGIFVGLWLGLSPGGTLLLGVLTASASYIVVPAAMRLALPEANPALYITVSLAITFPFNIVLGIPLYYAIVGGLTHASTGI